MLRLPNFGRKRQTYQVSGRDIRDPKTLGTGLGVLKGMFYGIRKGIQAFSGSPRERLPPAEPEIMPPIAIRFRRNLAKIAAAVEKI